MKLSHLQQILIYMQQFKKISAIHRVSDTILRIVFNKNDVLYFNMQRSNATIFKCQTYPRSKIYNAPFDIIIAKRFNRSNVESIELLNSDKIIRIKSSIASTYKQETTYLQIEFTGKYTNIIILDSENRVLEALRHVDIFSSFREVRVGQKLLDVPKAPFIAKEYPIESVEDFLYSVYAQEQNLRLTAIKKQKIALLSKKLKKMQRLYDTLESQESLQKIAHENQHFGNLVLSNVHTIKPYSREITLKEYNGDETTLKLEKAFATPFMISEMLFTKSKKAKQRAKHLYIEEESLRSKIEHLKLFIHTVTTLKESSAVEMLFPKQLQSKKVKQNDSIELFWIEGYKVQLGKSEKGNIELLQKAKAKDIWIHMKDRPSTHVIITTDKQSLPLSIIKSAAKLCVSFTTTAKDRFLVDYTPRREVTIQNGANVLYNKYKTIEIDTRD